MHPYVYLAYLLHLGKNEISGKAHNIYAEYLKMNGAGNHWDNSFYALINGVIYEKFTEAKMNFIFSEVQAWSKISSTGFLEFLKRYGNKK